VGHRVEENLSMISRVGCQPREGRERERKKEKEERERDRERETETEREE
jgi:hypothetical protein